jgi:ABC-2 type transport system permease protein
MVRTDFKLRYQGSVLGYLWSLLRPLALFGILYVVFVKFLHFGNGVPHYPVYLLLGIVIWNYFLEVTMGSLGAIVSKGDLLRKLNFPRYVLVMASALSAMINLGFNLLVVLLFAIFTGVPIQPAIALAPVFLVELVLLSIGVGFLLSALFVRFRDMSYIWEVVLQALFYATPILYPLNSLPSLYSHILILNPLAQMIQDLRLVVVTDQTRTITGVYGSGWMRLAPMGLTLLIVMASALYFRRRARFFAEEV